MVKGQKGEKRLQFKFLQFLQEISAGARGVVAPGSAPSTFSSKFLFMQGW